MTTGLKDPRAHAGSDTPALSAPMPCMMWLLIAMATIGGGLFGYDTGVISGALLMIEDVWDLDEFDEELVVAATVFAAAFGSLMSGYPSQVYGRKPMILISAVLYAFGAGTVCLAPGFTTLVFGRTVLGLGMGIASSVIPIYLAEASPSEYRGWIVSLNSIMIVVGQLLACSVNIVVENWSDTINWRISMGLAAVPAVIQLIGFIGLPESPRFLVQRGRDDEAKEVLHSIRGTPVDSDDPKVRAELADIVAGYEESKTDMSFFDMWASPPVRRAFLLGIGIMVIQQLAGINIVMYYGAVILEDAGFSSDDSIELTALLATAQLIGLLIGLQSIDFAGRRTLILSSGVGVIFFLACISISYANISSMQMVALFSVVLYLVTFGGGLSAGAWVVCSEIFPVYARGLGNAQAVAANWITDGIISLFFLSLASAITTAGVFALMCFCTICGILWLNGELPETKGKTLEEITEHFEKVSAQSAAGAEPSDSTPLLGAEEPEPAGASGAPGPVAQ